jgi:hypothetical protein
MRPPRLLPMARAWAPVSASRAAVCLRRRAIDALNADRVVNHKLFQGSRPDPRLGPAIEPIVDGRVWPILRRAICPPATDLQDVDDPADDFAIAPRLDTATVHRDRRLDRGELFVSQPEQVGQRFAPLTGSVESVPAESCQMEAGF